jgi:hypothetical protein
VERLRIDVRSRGEVVVHFPWQSVHVVNSDHFLNIRTATLREPRIRFDVDSALSARGADGTAAQTETDAQRPRGCTWAFSKLQRCSRLMHGLLGVTACLALDSSSGAQHAHAAAASHAAAAAAAAAAVPAAAPAPAAAAGGESASAEPVSRIAVGAVDDYTEQSDNPFGCTFLFNQYADTRCQRD